MRLRVTASAVLFAAICFVSAASAAQDNGHSYPCTPAFANQVAEGSRFAALAAHSNPNFRDPRFWEAVDPICQDFDGDGNTRWLSSSARWGGTNPWAFFDVPEGRPDQAIYSFPTISGGTYPNHGLIALDDNEPPLVKDTRQLYRKYDPHCCPTGGRSIRVIGFRGGAYQVLNQYQRPGSHKPQVKLCRDGRHRAQSVTTRAVKCGTARAFASNHALKAKRTGKFDHFFRRYLCNAKAGFGGWHVSCRKGRKRINYTYEAPEGYCGRLTQVGGGIFEVYARLIACGRARPFARHIGTGSDSTKVTRRAKELGIDYGETICRKKSKRIRWFSGA